MKYIFKYMLGGLFYLLCMTIVFLWHFDTNHFESFDEFIEDLKRHYSDDSFNDGLYG